MRRLLAAVLVGTVFVVAACSSGSKHGAATPSSEATPASPSAGAEPTRAAPAPVLRDLQKVDDVPFLANTSLIFATGGYGHGQGGYWRFERVYRDSSGALRRETLFHPPADLGITNVTGIEATDSGKFFLTLCIGDRCPLEGGPKQVRTRLYASNDGGITWSKESELDGEWWVRGTAGNEAVVVSFDSPSIAWKLLPANHDVTVPAEGADCCAPLRISGLLAWASKSVAAVIEHGSGRIYAPEIATPLSKRVERLVAVGANLAVTWADATTHEVGLGLFSTTGTPIVQPLRVPTGLDPRVALDAEHIIATVEYERPGTCTTSGISRGADPAIVDLAAGTYAFIHEPFYDEACSQGTQRVISVQLGPFAPVRTGGDCLNVRQAYGMTSPILACLHDGVLVRLLPNPPTDPGPPDYASWQTVGLPDGRTGWVKKEFLER